MEKFCLVVQEDIAWGRDLNPEAQNHILHCASCRELALGFTELGARLEQSLDFEIPDDFSQRVMDQIEAYQRKQRTSVWHSSFHFHFPKRVAAYAGLLLMLTLIFLPSLAG